MLGRRDSDGKLPTLSSTQYLLCFKQIERLQKPSILMCNHAMGFRFESVWHVCVKPLKPLLKPLAGM